MTTHSDLPPTIAGKRRKPFDHTCVDGLSRAMDRLYQAPSTSNDDREWLLARHGELSWIERRLVNGLHFDTVPEAILRPASQAQASAMTNSPFWIARGEPWKMGRPEAELFHFIAERVARMEGRSDDDI